MEMLATPYDWSPFISGPRSAGPALQYSGFGPKKCVNPKRVLIVEDHLDSARSMCMLVAEMGHTADYAINGYAGVDLMRRFRPDVILLDLGLPGIDGFEVCRRIKGDASLKHVRVIVITGYAQEEHRVRSLAAGCEVHLIKPVPTAVIEHLLDS
jgi:CheY-like chemotaxis protein